MTSLGDIVVGFKADTSGMMSGFALLRQNMTSVPGLAIAAGAAVVGMGVAAAKMAGDYQAAMDMVQALTGTSKAQMDQYDASLKNLAINAGVAPTALAKGLYNVLSAGYQGATAMKVLTLATEDAKIGMTDSAITSNALTIALRAFNVPASQMVAVNGEMIRTVTAGKMSMSDYASAISKTSSVAVQYHDTMENMNAALATLTFSGIKNANVAGTDYDNLLKLLNGNTDKATKAIQKFYPEFDQTQFKALSMADKIQFLNQILTTHGKNFSDVFAKQQNAAAAYTMLSTHMDTYISNLSNLSNQQQNATATANQWAITQAGFNETMSRAGAAVQVLMINVGSKLLPVLTNLAGAVAPIISNFSSWLINSGALTTGIALLVGGVQDAFSFIGKLVSIGSQIVGFFQKSQWAVDLLVAALAGIGIAIGVAVIPGMIAAGVAAIASFGAWAVAAGAAAIATLAAAAPFIAIGAIAGAVVFGIIQAVQHWGQITQWLGDVWHTVSTAIGGAFSWLGTQAHNIIFGIIGWFNNLAGIFKVLLGVALAALFPILVPIGAIVFAVTHWAAIMGWFRDVWKTIIKDIGDAFSWLGSLIHGVWDGIVGIIKGAINLVIGLIDNFIGGIDSIGIDVGPVHVHPNIGKIPMLAAGGFVGTGQPFIAGEAGPELITAGSSGARVTPLGAGGSGPLHIHFEINGQEIAEAIVDDMGKALVRNIRVKGSLKR